MELAFDCTANIRTHYRLCPMLNGTIKPEESGFGEPGFSSSAPVP